jgi:hypothetical protein
MPVDPYFAEDFDSARTKLRQSLGLPPALPAAP